MLNDEQVEIIIDHLNYRLESFEPSTCGFCKVSRKLQREHEKDNEPIEAIGEIEMYCLFCPLQKGAGKNDCVDARKEHLVDGMDGYSTDNYDYATSDSVEEHVSWMMDKANEFWGLNLCWSRTRTGDTVFNKEDKKNE